MKRTPVDVDFRGILFADHVPQMVGDRRTDWAFSIGYIKAMYDIARDERAKGEVPAIRRSSASMLKGDGDQKRRAADRPA